MRNMVQRLRRFMPEGYTVNHSICVHALAVGMVGVGIVFGDWSMAAAAAVILILA
jgi:hypothetical protein